MQYRGYNSELKIANIMFARLFRNMRITRSEIMRTIIEGLLKFLL